MQNYHLLSTIPCVKKLRNENENENAPAPRIAEMPRKSTNVHRMHLPYLQWQKAAQKAFKTQIREDNDEYIVGMHVSSNDEVRQVGVFKVMRLKEHGEYRDFIGMLNHTRVCVHTFQNLLNSLGLKETSEEFNIM